LLKGVKIEDFLKKNETQERVWHAFSNMLKFNVYLEAIVAYSKEGGRLELRDTELKEY